MTQTNNTEVKLTKSQVAEAIFRANLENVKSGEWTGYVFRDKTIGAIAIALDIKCASANGTYVKIKNALDIAGELEGLSIGRKYDPTKPKMQRKAKDSTGSVESQEEKELDKELEDAPMWTAVRVKDNKVLQAFCCMSPESAAQTCKDKGGARNGWSVVEGMREPGDVLEAAQMEAPTEEAA
jgi:hypothetical protein